MIIFRIWFAMFRFIYIYKSIFLKKTLLKISLWLKLSVWCLFSSKIAGLRPATLLKKRLKHRFFPANIANWYRRNVWSNSIQEPVKIKSCLLLIDLFDMFTQAVKSYEFLCPMSNKKIHMLKYGDSPNNQKWNPSFFATSFKVKCELIFVLTQKDSSTEVSHNGW